MEDITHQTEFLVSRGQDMVVISMPAQELATLVDSMVVLASLVTDIMENTKADAETTRIKYKSKFKFLGDREILLSDVIENLFDNRLVDLMDDYDTTTYEGVTHD